jgi:UDP-N-acetylglucosamine 2-epimerase (non-hydrolysing)
MISRLESVLLEQKPDLVLVPGDTNSTLAGAITAAKLNIPVAHIEAGARSYDNRMPEEINRRLTDHCSSLLFAATETCLKNLLKEGIDGDKIHIVGDTMFDVLLQQLPKAEKTTILDKLGVKTKAYALLTLHRQENVDSCENLKRITDAILRLKTLLVIFPVHPRTLKQLCSLKLYAKLKEQKHVKLIKPVSYLENINLIKNAKFVMTDSGGVQKEAFWLKTPCITLRENTEWTETVEMGANYLVGSNTGGIVKTAQKIIENEEALGKKLAELPNPFGDGHASQRILETIKGPKLSAR